MSPRREGGLTMASSFPRVSGDEPGGAASALSFDEFSPRERG